MRILFLSYWGYNDLLTTATILPHLNILVNFSEVEKVILCTIEREGLPISVNLPNKIKHTSFKSGLSKLDKLMDFKNIPKRINQICKTESIDKIICRGSMAGSIGYLAFTGSRVPFYVESYEPHAEYMVQSGIWKKWGLRYYLQNRWQRKQNLKAAGLITVSETFQKWLVHEGVESRKITTSPCGVDLNLFEYNEKKRDQIRKNLRILKNDIVGIYVGKFGGLYYQEEAFKLFTSISKVYTSFKLIILTQSNHGHIRSRLKDLGLAPGSLLIESVKQSEVPFYLSAADFGFCLHRSHKYSIGFSPVKNGEYWACGLPILIPENIGDDSAIVLSETVGATFNIGDNDSILEAAKRLRQIFKDSKSRDRIRQIARNHRSFTNVSKAYYSMLFESI